MHDSADDAGVNSATRLIPVPEVVVLPPSPGESASAAPPVRIFLGTEDAQHRAERVFIWSIEKLRDPNRRYEIFLMKNLPGFRTAGWRTGFTNYRFAIPDFAGRSGRAIYNDVDQIYLTDPAQLFDTALDGHGYLSISPQETSVMLLDCAVMSQWWNFSSAASRGKEELLAVPQELWGPLDAEWNARDLEYRRGQSRLLHFTALHTQPWQPTPRQYSYHPHPHGELWFSLEREADAAGFEVFNRQRPSRAFAATATACAAERETGDAAGPSLRVSFGQLTRESWPGAVFDEVRTTEGLERVPADDVPWVLEELFAHARRTVRLRVAPSSATDGDDDRLLQLIHRAAARHPAIDWSLEIVRSGGERLAFEPAPRRDPPRVWVLLGVKAGDNAQLRNLAGALGWPFEEKQLAFNSLRRLPNVLLGASRLSLTAESARTLTPPWPDLILSAGKRSAPVARWIARQSGGDCRLVHLGRPRQPLSHFDLVVTTPQYGLPARPNVVHNLLPLNRPSRERLAEAAAAWAPQLDSLPRPLVAVLVGGDSKPYVFDEQAAHRLADEANRTALAAGGSLLITSSPRTPPQSFEALCARVTVPAHVHRWSPTADNPYLAYLELADSFIVTADSASLLAEACSTGKPVVLFMPRDGGGNSVASRRLTARGTPHQQKTLARMRDWLVVNGLLTADRNLPALHQLLLLRGSIAAAGQSVEPARSEPLAPELELTAERARKLLVSGRLKSR